MVILPSVKKKATFLISNNRDSDNILWNTRRVELQLCLYLFKTT